MCGVSVNNNTQNFLWLYKNVKLFSSIINNQYIESEYVYCCCTVLQTINLQSSNKYVVI